MESFVQFFFLLVAQVTPLKHVESADEQAMPDYLIWRRIMEELFQVHWSEIFQPLRKR